MPGPRCKAAARTRRKAVGSLFQTSSTRKRRARGGTRRGSERPFSTREFFFYYLQICSRARKISHFKRFLSPVAGLPFSRGRTPAIWRGKPGPDSRPTYPPPAGRVDETTIDSLGLRVGRRFGYWFDFGDDWWHQINVEAIEDKVPKGKFPKVTARVGKSPPQYAEEDE